MDIRPVAARNALDRLIEGNRRFLSGHEWGAAGPARSKLARVASAQRPFAAILGCSDARVPVEIVFGPGGRAWVVEQKGIVKVMPPGGATAGGAPAIAIDLTGRLAAGGEAGLLGLAFDPKFFIGWPGPHRPHQVRLEGGDCSSDSYCYP